MRKTVVIFSLILFTSAAFAQDAIMKSSDVINLLMRNFEGMKSFQANFVQRVDGTVYKGEMYYKKPNKFRLIYKTPRHRVYSGGRYQEIVCNGEMLWTYIPKNNVVSEQEVKGGEFSYSGAGILRLKEDYNFGFYSTRGLEPVNAFRAADMNDGSADDPQDPYLNDDTRMAYHMDLRPKPHKQKTDKAGFSRLHVWIDKSGMVIRSIGISTTGKIIEYVFQDIEQNTAIPDTDFDFEIPQGEQVIRNNFATVE